MAWPSWSREVALLGLLQPSRNLGMLQGGLRLRHRGSKSNTECAVEELVCADVPPRESLETWISAEHLLAF